MQDAQSSPPFDPTKPASWKALRAEALLAEHQRVMVRRRAQEEAARAALPAPAALTIENRFRNLLSTWYVEFLMHAKRPWEREGRPLVDRVNQDGSTTTVGPYHLGQPLGEGEQVFRMITPEEALGIDDPDHPGFRMNEAQLEAKYGVGLYAERRTFLEDLLSKLALRGVDSEAVLDALERARFADEQACREGYRVDAARFLYGKRDVIAEQLRTAVRDALGLYNRAMRLLFDAAASVPVTISVETTGLLARLAERLDPEHEDRDPLWTAPSPFPQRRDRAGRRGKPWLADLQQALRSLGLRPREVTGLLTAVGLLTRSLRRRSPAPKRRTLWPKRLPCLKCERPRLATNAGDRYHARCRRARTD